MTPATKPNARSFALALVAALAFGLFASAQAQSTSAEQNIAYILATDTDGMTIDCPAGYAITDLASCFVITGSFDLAASSLELAVSKYRGDTSWVSPWSRSDGGNVRTRLLDVKDVPVIQLFLTPDADARNSDYSTVVWIIQMARFP